MLRPDERLAAERITGDEDARKALQRRTLFTVMASRSTPPLPWYSVLSLMPMGGTYEAGLLRDRVGAVRPL